MKRTILLLAVLLLLPFGLRAEQSPTQIVLMGSGWTDDNFSQAMDIGIKTGLQVSIDKDKGLWVRAVYSRWELGNEATHSLTPSLLMDWYVGKRWSFYLHFGGEMYVDGDLTGTDLFTGFGFGRRLWTEAGTNTIPAHIDIFADMIFADGSGQFSGDYVQLNLGVRFGRPVK